MSDDRSNAGGGGIGLLGILFVVFLVLKLCDVITWSWWFVTAPLWGPIALMLVLIILAMIGSGLYAMFGPTKRDR